MARAMQRNTPGNLGNCAICDAISDTSTLTKSVGVAFCDIFIHSYININNMKEQSWRAYPDDFTCLNDNFLYACRD